MFDYESIPLFRYFYPRKYGDSPSGYASPKWVSELMMNVMSSAGAAISRNETSPIADPNLYCGLSQIVAHDVPIYWLDKHLAESLDNTTFPTGVTLADLMIPLNGFITMVPRNVVRSGWIGFSRIEPNKVYGLGNETVPLTSIRFPSFNTSSIPEPRLVMFNIEEVDNVAVTALAHVTANTTLDEFFSFPSMNQKDEPEKQSLRQLCNLALNIVSYMTATPNSVTEGGILRRKREGKKERKELWSCNWIGKGYRSKHRTEGDGTGKSPRVHWRRGHWRNQPIGPVTEDPENRKKSLIWIEPVLVGLHEEI